MSRARISAIAKERPELAGLAVLLALGLIARIYFMAVWHPGLTAYSDSGIYFQGAYDSVWADPFRTTGYAMFLHVLHWVTPHLSFAIAVQHLLGLGAAVLIFFTVLRIGGPPWLGLIPAAILTLGGDELFIEHAALSEAVYIFLMCLALYFAVRAREGPLGWAAAAGLVLGLSVWDRAAGIALLAVIPIWLLLSEWRPTRETATRAGLCLLVGIVAIGVYVFWRHEASGLSGLTTNGNWNLYGRVAPWADCDKFDPPAGTEGLCEDTPPSERDTRAEDYIFGGGSPAQLLYGPPYLVSSDPDAMDDLRKWSIAAIRGQPGAYLDAVWQDTIRLVDSNHDSDGALSADQLIAYLIGGHDYALGDVPLDQGGNSFVDSWEGPLYPGESIHHGNIQPLRDWEKLTRFSGIWMVVLLVLALAVPWTVPGRARSGACLMSAVALSLLLFPILSKSYDYRFVIPAMGPLFAAAALSAWGYASIFTSGRSPRRPAPASRQ